MTQIMFPNNPCACIQRGVQICFNYVEDCSNNCLQSGFGKLNNWPKSHKIFAQI